MFNIKIPNQRENEIQDFWIEEVQPFIMNKIAEFKKDYNNIEPKFLQLLDWLNEPNNLYRLILSKPKELLGIYKSWQKDYQFQESNQNIFGDKGMNSKTYVEYFKKIIDYKGFCSDKENTYDLTKRLDVSVCPYCNRQFTYTIIKQSNKGKSNNITRPELDHYFPQSKYPMFSLSLYNLIPCCHICNSIIKRNRDLDIQENYHPYIDENKNFSFCYIKLSSQPSKILIKYNGLKKAENTCNFFKLQEVYSMHNSEADRLDELRMQYPDEYIKDIISKFKKCGFSLKKEQILKIIYSEYIIKDEDKMILGKLKNDLYKCAKKQYSV